MRSEWRFGRGGAKLDEGQPSQARNKTGGTFDSIENVTIVMYCELHPDFIPLSRHSVSIDFFNVHYNSQN